MKPKVFYLSTSLNIGGTEKYVLTLIENLKNDYDFTVGYLKDKGFYGEELEKRNIEVLHFNGFWDLAKHLKANNYSILHTFLFRANILGRLAGKFAKVPIVISNQQAIDDWKKFYHSWLEGFTSQWCGLIIANSQTAKGLLVNRDGVDENKIAVIYNGLNFEAFKTKSTTDEIRKELNIAKNAVVAVYAGRLHAEKGADLLPKIALDTKDTVFLIVGDGPQKEAIALQAKTLGIADRFIMTGWRMDIPDILNASDIYILPSREESFPQGIIEAMYYSLPVVVTDVGGVKELVDNNVNGIIVKPNDTKEFSKALSGLVTDRKKAEGLGRNGKVKCPVYALDILLDKTKDLYKDMIKNM